MARFYGQLEPRCIGSAHGHQLILRHWTTLLRTGAYLGYRRVTKQEVLGLNLGRDTNYPNWYSSVFCICPLSHLQPITDSSLPSYCVSSWYSLWHPFVTSIVRTRPYHFVFMSSRREFVSPFSLLKWSEVLSFRSINDDPQQIKYNKCIH
jgi:hypothetical protein